jgi:DNA invertase Pin-like site-specific DNA recombinase
MQKQSTGKVIGYARVSTEDQDLRLQIAALEAAGCWNIYKEKRSATRGPRPELELALTDLRAGDTLLVWKFDRLVRNARDAYKLLDRIEESGAEIRSLTEPHLSTKTPLDRFLMGLTALLAQLEVDQTAARTSAGIAALKAQGFDYGPKPMLSEAKAAALVRMRKGGASIADTARKFGVSTGSVRNYMLRAQRKRKR